MAKNILMILGLKNVYTFEMLYRPQIISAFANFYFFQKIIFFIPLIV